MTIKISARTIAKAYADQEWRNKWGAKMANHRHEVAEFHRKMTEARAAAVEAKQS